ncbi:hypothetical protein BAE44_0007040 [Dichanthelium oligosanthes]|uniref:Protein kinase domain-containing protein n=1 Tax=Dichanthelium oligosanthes TaxID=888268 RepID=A0A1E5W3F2_9POAL|nr:hypothetical protein BAE44_0007040 [Dichanthelium oligosanthes]
MDAAAKKMTRSISRQLSSGAARLWRQMSLDPHTPRRGAPGGGGGGGAGPTRFAIARQSSLDPTPRAGQDGSSAHQQLAVPENLDATMRLLFAACQGDAAGVEELLRGGVDVDSIDLDGRTALHIASCEGQGEVVRLLLDWKANINARDRWGSTPAADAKHYGHFEVYNLLRARGAKVPRILTVLLAILFYRVPIWRNGMAQKCLLRYLTKTASRMQIACNIYLHEHLSLGDLASYLEIKGRLKSHKAIRFSLDIARCVSIYLFLFKFCVVSVEYNEITLSSSFLLALPLNRKKVSSRFLSSCSGDSITSTSASLSQSFMEICHQSCRNIVRDDEGQLKVADFGSLSLIKASEDKLQMAQPMTQLDSVYIAPEIYRNEPFDRSVDVFAFGLILYEMIEGSPAFHPKPQEEAAKMICLEGLRPQFKNKPKYYPNDVKELIQECWDPAPSVRPTFAEIIVRLNRIHASCAKQARWRDTFKLPWYISG